MEIDPVIFWNVVLTLIIAPAVWAFRNMMAELKRIDILLNRTREDRKKYMTSKCLERRL